MKQAQNQKLVAALILVGLIGFLLPHFAFAQNVCPATIQGAPAGCIYKLDSVTGIKVQHDQADRQLDLKSATLTLTLQVATPPKNKTLPVQGTLLVVTGGQLSYGDQTFNVEKGHAMTVAVDSNIALRVEFTAKSANGGELSYGCKGLIDNNNGQAQSSLDGIFHEGQEKGALLFILTVASEGVSQAG